MELKEETLAPHQVEHIKNYSGSVMEPHFVATVLLL